MAATVNPPLQMKSASECAEGQDAAIDTRSSQADRAVDAPLEAGELIKPSPETISSAKAEHDSPVLQEGDPVAKKPSLQEQTNLLPTKQLLVVFFGCALSLMLSMLDQTIVANLIPTLARDFNAGRSVSWVATSYLLTSTAFQPIVGRLSDIFGRKRMMLVAIAFFWVGSLASSLAQNMPELIAFRSVQGIGGGAILSLVMIVMSDVVSLRERGKYQGILSIFVALSNGLGPLIGGAIAENTTWRWAFWINLPLGVGAFLVILFFLPLRHVKGSAKVKLQQIDWGGCALVLAGCTLLLLALQWAGSTYVWQSAHVLAPLVIGIAILGFFGLYEWRLAHLPIIPLRLFGNLSLVACYFITVTNGSIYYVQLFYLPQYFQVLKGEGPVRSGLLMLPLIITMVATSAASGFAVSKTGNYKVNIVMGWCFWTISLGLLSTLDENSSTGMIVGYLLFNGVGCGQTFQTTLVAIQAAVDRKDMAVATGLRNFIRMLGGTLSLAIAQTIISSTLRSSSGLSSSTLGEILDNPISIYSTSGLTGDQIQDVRSAYRTGFRILWLVCTALAGLSTFTSVFFLKHTSLTRGDEEEQKAKSAAWLAERKERHRHGHGKGQETESV